MEAKGQKHPVGTAGVGFRAPTEDDLEAIQAGWDRAVPQDPLGTFARSSRDFVLLSENESRKQSVRSNVSDYNKGTAVVRLGAKKKESNHAE